MNQLSTKHNNKFIVQSNEMTEAAYHLPLVCKRVLWLCLSQIQRGETCDGIFNIHVNDYQTLFGVSATTASKDVKSGLNSLVNNSVTFFNKDSEYTEIKRPWLAEAALKASKGIWRVELNHKIIPYMVGLTEQFTSFYLHECGKLNNTRTIRLYESLCQFKSSGIWAVTTNWLAIRYELPKSQCNNFAEMKRSFLDPALKRINKETPLTVSFKREFGDDGKVNKLIFNIIDSRTE